MSNGKDYILFYLKMLLESIDHEGELRFSESIPYNEQMLSVITNTNIDIVKSAMKIFIDLNMIEVFDDSTIYMNEVQRLIGSETAVAERVRNHRQKIKALQCNTEETKCNTEIEKDIDKKKDKNTILEEFETLWKMYPNKKGKDKALGYYQKARKSGTTFEEVEQGIKNYCKEIQVKQTSTQYIKHGSTWFNNKGWLDNYDFTYNPNANQKASKYGYVPDDGSDLPY